MYLMITNYMVCVSTSQNEITTSQRKFWNTIMPLNCMLKSKPG